MQSWIRVSGRVGGVRGVGGKPAEPSQAKPSQANPSAAYGPQAWPPAWPPSVAPSVAPRTSFYPAALAQGPRRSPLEGRLRIVAGMFRQARELALRQAWHPYAPCWRWQHSGRQALHVSAFCLHQTGKQSGQTIERVGPTQRSSVHSGESWEQRAQKNKNNKHTKT